MTEKEMVERDQICEVVAGIQRRVARALIDRAGQLHSEAKQASVDTATVKLATAFALTQLAETILDNLP